MRVGVIGTGVMGKNHVRVYSKMRGVDEVLVYDSKPDAAERVAVQYSAEKCGSIDELLGKVDMVSLCVPTSLHFSIAEQCLGAGVAILIEKPVAGDVAQAEKLLDLANKEGVIAGVGHIERFNPVVHEIGKHLGREMSYLSIRRHNVGSGRITDADVILDLMIHDIDIVWNAFFSGMEYKIDGAIGGGSPGHVKIAQVIATFGNANVSISASKISSKRIREILLEDEEKTIIGDMLSQEIYIYRKPERNEISEGKYTLESLMEKVSVARAEPLELELRSFMDAVKGVKKFEVGLEDGIRALKICGEIKGRLA